MKIIFLSAVTLMFSMSAVATTKTLKACSKSAISRLNEQAEEKATEGFTDAYYMLNEEKEIVGIYLSDKKTEMYAEVCDGVDAHKDGLIVANHWYYWDGEGSSSPSKWKIGSTPVLTQDEGQARLHVISARPGKKVKIIFTVWGWNESRNDLEIRKDFLTLQKL